jgi:solute:Na+ symporter, SSS family
LAIHFLDLCVIALYLAGVTLFGLCFRSENRSLKSYFLGSKTLPWWAISLSIVAAETSTLTLISIPGVAYQGDFSFLQLALGYIFGRIVISLLLIPGYFRHEIYTAYQWIGARFGRRLQRLTAAIFLFTRAGAEGVRIYAVSILISIALSLSGSWMGDATSIGLIIALTLVYTYHGGLNAVIWTDVLQTGIYSIASIIGLFTMIHAVPGGWTEFFQFGQAAGKFHVLNFSWSFHQPYTFFAGLIGGTFITTASHGTDQLLVQRLLAAKNEGAAKKALIFSGFLVFAQFAFYLMIGAALFVFYRGAPVATSSDHIYPDFIVHSMPEGVCGLLIAAVLAAAMSNLSAALNSLASTSVMDFFSEWFPNSEESALIKISHIMTLVWAVILFALAMISRRGGRVVETALAISSVSYGALLGVFLVGRLTKKVDEKSAMFGMACGFTVNLYAWTQTTLAFPWYVPLGSLVTIAITALTSPLVKSAPLRIGIKG